MYNNILVPVVFDHEPGAEQALDVARELLAENGKITLFHVVEEMPGYISSQLPKDAFKNTLTHAETKLKEIARNLAKDATVSIARGHSSRTILDRSISMNADCIILGSHKPGLSDYMLGSTASRVVRHATCSVHVLR